MPALELEQYLLALRATTATDLNTPENSFLPHLKPLIEAALEGLQPRVAVITHPKSTLRSGLPDAGIIEAASNELTGALEAEAPTTEILDRDLAHPKTRTAWEQAERYSRSVGPTLLTNFRDFVLVIDAQEVRRITLGSWADVLGADARALAARHARDLDDLLRDWATRRRTISRPADLAARLADYARVALARLESHESAGLGALERTLTDALGLHFTAAQGEHFFRSTLVQTLFYGLFSAFVLRAREGERADTFSWQKAADYLRVPVIGAIFEEVAKVSNLRRLGLRDPLEWAEAALRRVDTDAFFANFARDRAILYFYEPFLEAFDPELRDQLGVWYTPPEVVTYQVRKVHALLQTELGLEDGLADPSVVVLDPATGTGSYPLEVARVIHAHLAETRPATAAARTREAMVKRVFGFEILPAPYVIAHFQLGLLLQELGAPLGDHERAGVYLTNSLTGWEARDGEPGKLEFEEFQHELEAAQAVKREAKVLVMLGNPPYNRFSGVAEDEEGRLLIAPYKAGLMEKWGIRKQLLDDLYIRFFRLAEWRISENQQRRGIVSYISNSSWLDGASHPVMRASLLRNFDKIWIDNLNGDKFKTGKRTPAGTSDQSIFTTQQDSRGVQVGVAITTFVDSGGGDNIAEVEYRDLWGLAREKRVELLDESGVYETLVPSAQTRWVLLKTGGASSFLDWPRILDVFPTAFQGLNTNRDGGVIAIDRGVLERRMSAYYDPSLTFADVGRINSVLVTDALPAFDARATRDLLLSRSGYRADRFVPLTYRPLDTRWLYWEEVGKLLNAKRANFFAQVFPGNIFLNATSKQRRSGPWDLMTVSTNFVDLHVHEPDLRAFPFLIRPSEAHPDYLEPNLARPVLEKVAALWDAPLAPGKSASPEAFAAAEAVFYHAVAILQSPAYRTENEGYLRQDWPRLPIPFSRDTLEASAALGRRVAALLQPEVRVPGVTAGRLEPHLAGVAVPTMADGSVVQPGESLALTVGYGGQGKYVPRANDPTAGDLWWSERGYWANVPRAAWAFTIGGYPVLKKWLSYRHVRDLGRPLSLDELEYVPEMTRRVLALIALGTELDANYELVKLVSGTTGT